MKGEIWDSKVVGDLRYFSGYDKSFQIGRMDSETTNGFRHDKCDHDRVYTQVSSFTFKRLY